MATALLPLRKLAEAADADPSRWRNPHDSERIVRDSSERLAFRDRPEERAQAAAVVDKLHAVLDARNDLAGDLPPSDRRDVLVDRLRARLRKDAS